MTTAITLTLPNSLSLYKEYHALPFRASDVSSECSNAQAFKLYHAVFRALRANRRRRTPTNDANFRGKSSWFSNGRNNNRFFDARSACLNRLFLADRENNAPFLTSAILPIFNDRSPNRATRERRRGDSPSRRGPLTSRPFHENRRKSPQARNAWLGREDSNLRMAESKSAALPLGDAPSFAGVAPARAIPIRRLALLRNMLVTTFRDAARRH